MIQHAPDQIINDLTVATLFVLSAIDVAVHVYLDWNKLQKGRSIREPETVESTPKGALLAATISTLLSFGLVLIIIISWATGGGMDALYRAIPIIFIESKILWIIGFFMTSFGITLHLWARYVRQEMATSWVMDHKHKLVTRGPYAFIRHPSYTAYFICFIGLFFLLPSALSLLLFPGIPAYLLIAQAEEQMLMKHFGEEYEAYKRKAGMFLPKIR